MLAGLAYPYDEARQIIRIKIVIELETLLDFYPHSIQLHLQRVAKYRMEILLRSEKKRSMLLA
jgi:hypothetical protein